MIKLTTVAQFKRELKVGNEIKTIFHKEFNGRTTNGEVIYKSKDLGTREIAIVQSNSFAMKTKKTDGTYTNSWCDYPKALKSKFENGSIIILEDDGSPVLTYTLI